MPVARADPGGLTESEARRRLVARGPRPKPETSRSTASIVRANTLTVFNLILAVFGILTLVAGDLRDALFLTILVLNSGIGIVQELRAKRALDRLAALVAPTATVVRDGTARTVGVDEVVEADLVQVAAGDKIVADGRLMRAEGLRLDESILTGESSSVVRSAGDEIRAGSFVAEGSGAYQATAVGEDSYAARVTGEAREFRHPRSPLEQAMNRLLLVLVVVMIPLAALLIGALVERREPVAESVATAAAGVVTLVPEGLILLMSLTYAVSALRMTRRGALTQQLSAIEALASIDVVCVDKTGTLTEEALRVVEVVPATGVEEERLMVDLGRYAASFSGRNRTLDAIADAAAVDAEEPVAQVAFSPRRRWSALRLSGTTFVMGAPELFPLGPLAARAEAEQEEGRRVIAFGTTPAVIGGDEDGAPPEALEPLGIAVLAESLRQDARATVEFLRAEGIDVVVISGDAPATAAAIARDAGIPVTSPPRDGGDLPPDRAGLVEVVAGTSVFGRTPPHEKRRLVEALAATGRNVAMIGDGVNDVPALKAARLAIAPGSGAQMARAVSDLVLVSGGFSAVPSLIAEGRKLLRNLQRVAKLFVAKSSLAAFLILTIGLLPTSYPFLPRHLTLVSAITIGIPAFFLALAPSSGPWRPASVLRDIGRFAVPAGAAAGFGVVSAFAFALEVADLSLTEARTVATTALVLIGLYLVLALEASGRTRGLWVGGLCAALLALYGFVLANAGMRDFFALVVPGPVAILSALVGASLTVFGLWMTDEGFLPGRTSALRP
jgi:P-type E1-E2 ATPase